MNVIGINWAQEILRRFWRVPAATALAPTLGTEVVPTFDLGNPPQVLASLGGVLPCCGFGTMAAGGAGQWNRITLNNNTSDRIYVVERIRVWSATSGGFRLAIYPAAGTTGGVVGVRDIRFAQARPSAIIGQNVQGAQFVTANYTQHQLLTTNFEYEPPQLPWILPPGQAVSGYGLVVEQTVNNTALNVAFYWTERLVSAGFETTGL